MQAGQLGAAKCALAWSCALGWLELRGLGCCAGTSAERETPRNNQRIWKGKSTRLKSVQARE